MKQDHAPSSAANLTKTEAVWRAIEELGYRAPVSEILEYVRTRFGIDADSPGEPLDPAPQPPAKQSVRAAPPAPQARKPAAQRKPRGRNDSAD